MKKLTAGVLTVLITSGFSGIASAEIASKSYVDTQNTTQTTTINTTLATKADTTYVDTGLAAKANTADLGALATKDVIVTTDITDANVTKPKLSLDVQASLDKADTSVQSADLTGFATTTDVNTALATKADTTYVDTQDTALNTAIAGKADTTYVDTGLAAKADTITVNAALATKADTTYVDTGLAAKADAATTYNKTEVDTALGTKADTITVNAALATKADTTYVDTGLAAKADTATTLSGYGITDAMTTTDINTALSTKADTASLGTLATAAPGACSDPLNKCVLTFDGTTYSWEIVER
ncbi:MAG: hypothetical protein JW974_03930 [Alphaproteobacteria bacterium]|nr:hypothetical protein [Alphaproteobacteria bacterium]MBN2675137.1 hypothetical protein [Alphaproteobacteria bacterium]